MPSLPPAWRACRFGAGRSQSEGVPGRATRGCAPPALRSRSGSAPTRRGAITPATSGACATAGPNVTLKLAVSADGKVGAAGRKPLAITGAETRARVHLLRAQSDAIMVGIGTVLADDPLLTCRLPGMENAFAGYASCSTARCAYRRRRGSLQTARETPVWAVCGPQAPACGGAGVAGARRGSACTPRSEMPAVSISRPC